MLGGDETGALCENDSDLCGVSQGTSFKKSSMDLVCVIADSIQLFPYEFSNSTQKLSD